MQVTDRAGRPYIIGGKATNYTGTLADMRRYGPVEVVVVEVGPGWLVTIKHPTHGLLTIHGYDLEAIAPGDGSPSHDVADWPGLRPADKSGQLLLF